MEIFSSFSHNQCVFGNQSIYQKPRVGIGGGGHRMMTHVFHPSCYGNIKSAQGDFRGGGSNRSHSPGTHTIHRGSSALFRESSQDGRGPPQGEPLIFFLGGGTPHVLFHHIGTDLGVATQELTDDLHHHVICAGVPKKSLFSSSAERCANTIHQDYFS